MKLYLSRKPFVFGEMIEVKNEFGDVVFYCQMSSLELSKKFIILSADQQYLASGESSSILKTEEFILNYNDRTTVLSRQFNSLKLEGSDWHINEYSLNHHIDIVEGTKTILSIHRKWFTWGPQYIIEMQNSENAVVSLCLVLCMEHIRLSRKVFAFLSSL